LLDSLAFEDDIPLLDLALEVTPTSDLAYPFFPFFTTLLTILFIVELAPTSDRAF
jgi:hypothetical protein